MKSLMLVFLCLYFVADSFGSPLVFKLTKELTGKEEIVALLDTSKYKQIRILITSNSQFVSSDRLQNLEFSLSSARLRYETSKRRFDAGLVGAFESEAAKKELDEAQMIYDQAVASKLQVRFYSQDADSEDLLEELNNKPFNQSFVIDSPPSKLIIKASGMGKVKISIWGTL